MAQPSIKKGQDRYAGITSLPSPTFSEDEALNKDFPKVAPVVYQPKSLAEQGLSESTVDRLNALPRPNPGAVYSDGRRDYPSLEAMKTANPNMSMIGNPPSAERQYQAQRDRAFLDSIGSGAVGLGTMAYAMGGSPDAIQASTQFDNALGGLGVGAAMRPGRATLQISRIPAPQRDVKDWPSNSGFLYSVNGEIPPKYGIDRYGEEGKLGEKQQGMFSAPRGTPYEQRAVGHRPEDHPYYAYETVTDTRSPRPSRALVRPAGRRLAIRTSRKYGHPFGWR